MRRFIHVTVTKEENQFNSKSSSGKLSYVGRFMQLVAGVIRCRRNSFPGGCCRRIEIAKIHIHVTHCKGKYVAQGKIVQHYQLLQDTSCCNIQFIPKVTGNPLDKQYLAPAPLILKPCTNYYSTEEEEKQALNIKALL